MFEEKPRVTFQHQAEGTWGEFATPAGRVAFILTKARLGTGTNVKDGHIDHEWRLTAQLRPVREVLAISTLDFGQLLQRDLDDHRVSTMLLPYLLETRRAGPAFFPPIVAALLPFSGNDPVESYPEAVRSGPHLDDGVHFLDDSYGAALEVRRLATQGGDLHRIRLGRVRWNDELAKLVVIDGQHRAMALLAIDRTLNNSWDKANGNRYRHFYEHRVRDLMKDAKEGGRAIDLEGIEIPVTLCWFPDLTGAKGSAQRAARKLFVDVNKEARAPSEARLVLLSDTELFNIFTRSLLNRLREPDPPLPLWAIEYDNPDKDAARPVRWSVLTNLNFLKLAVIHTVFGPKKYVKNVELKFAGRWPLDEMNAYMREQLGINDLFPSQIDDDDRVIARADIGNTHFPITGVDALAQRFRTSWGAAILTVLGSLRPYSAHHKALSELYANWLTDDAISSLARDAIFEGVGMFWTLRDSFNSWLEAQKQAGTKLPQQDVVKTWDIIEKKAEEFRGLRSVQYLGKAGKQDLEEPREAYDVFNTHACQLGAILAFATLVARKELQHSQVAAFAEYIVAAWNAALIAPQPNANGKDRKLVFARRRANRWPLNLIGKMDTPLAVYFRYFWLELLGSPEARATLGAEVDGVDLGVLVTRSRTLYMRYLVEEQSKALKRTHPRWNGARIQDKAFEQVSKDLGVALKRWFAVPEDSWTTWLEGARTAIVSRPAPVEGDDITDAEADTSEGNEAIDESVEDELAEDEDE